jgi:hypothetical protein
MVMQTITINTTTYKVANVVDGDYGDDALTTSETFEFDPDWDDATPVEWAADLLRTEGITDPSTVPFAPGAWYRNHYVFNCFEGLDAEVTAHLSGFTRAEQREIYALVTA